MPQGGTKPTRKHDFQAGTDIIAEEVDTDFDRIYTHATTDAPLGWFELVDSNGTSQGLEFVSASAPTFKVQTSNPVNITDIISKGMKVRVEQSTGGTKHGTIVTDPTVNSSSKTEFEILTTDTIENEAINNPVFSAQDNPHGWDQPWPEFHVYLASDQSLSNNTSTKILFDSVQYDPYGFFDTGNSEFTPNFTALWSVAHSIGHGDSNNAIEVIIGSILINGGNAQSEYNFTYGSGIGNFLVASNARNAVQINSGDTITVEALTKNANNNGGGLVFQDGFRRTFLSLKLSSLHT